MKCRIWEAELGREKERGGNDARAASKRCFIPEAVQGGDYGTAYGATMPKAAKLTGTGNSQVPILEDARGARCGPETTRRGGSTREMKVLRYIEMIR